MNPLRVYLHTDGLARFASVKYSEKLETLNDRYMHLTNYSINKLSNNYDKNDDANACKGMKWTIKSLWSYLEERGVNTKKLWGAMRNLVLRTVLAGEGPINSMIKTNLQSRYNSYELFGVDVILDSELVSILSILIIFSELTNFNCFIFRKIGSLALRSQHFAIPSLIFELGYGCERTACDGSFKYSHVSGELDFSLEKLRLETTNFRDFADPTKNTSCSTNWLG